MADDIIYYRATDPETVRQTLERYEERVAEFNAEVKQFEQDHFDGEHQLAVMGNGDVLFASHILDERNQWSPRGKFERNASLMDPGEKVAEIPPGWHYYKKDNEIRPYRGGSDADSKAACAAIDDLNTKSPNGLRTWIADIFDVDLHGFGFEPVGDTFYILRGQTWITRDWDGNEHFEKVKVSTYWIDKEAAEEAAKEESEDV